jgi:hypothetical protein
MTWAAYGPPWAAMRRRIRQMTASAGTTCPRMPRSPSAFPQAIGRLALLTISAPTRIRTCAHGSGESENLGLRPRQMLASKQFRSAVGPRARWGVSIHVVSRGDHRPGYSRPPA